MNSDYEQARLKLLKHLSYGPRSKKALVDKLLEQGFSHETAERAADEMEERGFVNDRKTAADYVAYAVESKAYGKHRILLELENRKIEAETAENAYREYMREREEQGGDANIDLDNAVNTLLKRMRQQGISAEELDGGDVRRLTGFLHRRGFSFDIIRKAFAACRGV